MAAEPKTIVISDIHMSNGKSYSWFQVANSDKLTGMLNSIAQDSDVEELVLLGDLFDLWLYPLDEIPCTVKEILDKNHFVSAALRHCVEKIPHVYYMNGNHDMAVTADDLKLLSSGGKEIQRLSTEDYKKLHPNRHLEHGHAADMFNAPADADDTIGGYPLGYFITRLVATAAKQNEVWKALRKLYDTLGWLHMSIAPPEPPAGFEAVAPERLAVPSMGSALVGLIITPLEKFAGVDDKTPIEFSQEDLNEKLGGKQPTVGDIKGKYGNLYTKWSALYSGAKLLKAMVATRELDWYAKDLLASDPALKVLVMGHTHASVSGSQYDNDGCWCDPAAFGHDVADPTYVEIVGDRAAPKTWKKSAEQ